MYVITKVGRYFFGACFAVVLIIFVLRLLLLFFWVQENRARFQVIEIFSERVLWGVLDMFWCWEQLFGGNEKCLG